MCVLCQYASRTVVLFKNVVCNIHNVNRERETCRAHPKRIIGVRTILMVIDRGLFIYF